ncbi:ABC transporter substrate-binding protein [Corynebacterium atypicum]|uniref:ABC transporter substrate-binding protein n=1 Tax=Corynebacterium atypicum TaxID=191610 RepID=A0ABM5QN37_9CORY|nr:ABC transporter substrate-binding protein [Corynebacterium atypicum]AIG64223.1 ABC transporter substrate-binding protein [Corynebacterium atypicum]
MLPVRRAVAAVITAGALTLGLSSCVTNEETSTPQGWQPILPEKDPAVAALVPPELAQRGTLLSATNPPFAPFEFKDSEGNLIGFEMDLARAVGSVMGLKTEIRQQDFAMILPAINGGTIDFGASGFTDTPERQENFDFVDFLYAGIQWAQQEGAAPIDPDHACGLTVAVQRATVGETDDVRPKSEECVARGEEPIEVLSYETADQAATALVVGRADAFSADSPVIAWAVERAGGKITTTGEIFAAAPYGFATPKGSQLTDAVAAAMQVLIESGDYQRILAQWNIEDGLLDQALINEEPAELS